MVIPGKPPGPGCHALPVVAQLTDKERQIADSVARGRTNREVAGELKLSHKTVEWTLTRVYRKLGVRSRTELVLLLVKHESGMEPGFSPGSHDGEIWAVRPIENSMAKADVVENRTGDERGGT